MIFQSGESSANAFFQRILLEYQAKVFFHLRFGVEFCLLGGVGGVCIQETGACHLGRGGDP